MSPSKSPRPDPKTPTKSTGRLDAPAHATLLRILKERFEENRDRHPGVEWSRVEARLLANPEKLGALHAMESSGGEPDVVGFDPKSGEVRFVDCAAESPIGRRSLCYDDAALEARKENKPKGSAQGRADSLGVELLTEEEYFALQSLGEFDLKTSSWLKSPPEIRRRGGAIYGERRYGRVFVGHNGAQSYYAVRGFRGALRV